MLPVQLPGTSCRHIPIVNGGALQLLYILHCIVILYCACEVWCPRSEVVDLKQCDLALCYHCSLRIYATSSSCCITGERKTRLGCWPEWLLLQL